MKKRLLGSIATAVMMTLLLSSAGGLAFARDRVPMTPELAAKKEMVRKQRAQRVTNAQRKDAAQALKAERLKVYQARKATRQATPAPTENR